MTFTVTIHASAEAWDSVGDLLKGLGLSRVVVMTTI